MIAYRAARHARDHYNNHDAARSNEAVLTAVVFAWLAVEALLNEQGHREIDRRGRGSTIVYAAVERGAHGFERVQAILTYLYGRGLKDGEHPANDLKHLPPQEKSQKERSLRQCRRGFGTGSCTTSFETPAW